MAGNLVGGAVIGLAFNLLMAAVLDVTQKLATYSSSLSRIKSTLVSIKPIIDDIEKLNRVLDRPPEETNMFLDRLRDGEKLVRKCLTIEYWNIYKRYTYSKRLNYLHESLLRFFQLDAQALVVRDSKRALVGLKDIDEKMEEVISILQNGFPGWCNVPGVPDFVIGLEEPLQELKLMLLKDDKSVVVVSAPGGCGKTTLAKMLCNDSEFQGTYKGNIFFVTVSRTPDLKRIVQKVFQSKKNQVPDFRSEEEAMNQFELLLRHLRPNPVLLVLDDVWTGSEFIIERFRISQPGYKVLVTSRSIFPGYDSTYKLRLLNDRDAKTLFCHSAFKDGICNVQNSLVDKVVAGCGGFPLALKVVGQSLRGEPEARWRHRIQKWSNGESIFCTNNHLLTILQSSIEALDEPVLKECYLDLGLFPEDQKIPATALLDLWVELYNLGEDGLDTFVHLLELSNRNLANLVLSRKGEPDEADYCRGHYIMQHDLLRDLCLHLSTLEPINQRNRLIMEIKGNDLSKWWNTRNEHARILSISTDETFSSNWHDMQLSEVEVLVLNFESRIYALPRFMESMCQLKVLVLTNYGFHPAELKNVHLLGHFSNLKRIRLEHVSIPLISTSMLQLQNLQKISLVMCDMEKAFETCSLRTPNIGPNLVEINIDYCADLIELPVGFFDLVNLKKLTISYCQELIALPRELGKLTNLEVLRLYSCTKLSDLPPSVGDLQKLKLLDLSDCIALACLPEEIGELRALRTIHMEGCRDLSGLPISVRDLEKLESVICDEETACTWRLYKGYLKNMEIKVVKRDANLNWLPGLKV